MPESIQFETPENVQVSYRPAGLGSRFLAWFIDQFILGMLMICTIFLLALLGASLASFGDFLRDLFRDAETPQDMGIYVVGLVFLILGLGSFLYYGLSEFLMNGQTIGKRQLKLRVVKMDGFALDAGSVFVRNIFRVLDHIPLLWVVPLVSKRSQRLGDMVAGTVIVADQTERIGPLREFLLKTPTADSLFRFDALTLQRLRPTDVGALEQVLERWGDLPELQRRQLLDSLCEPLARRLQVEPPAHEDRLRFLTELLAAEYRRQYRQLG